MVSHLRYGVLQHITASTRSTGRTRYTVSLNPANAVLKQDPCPGAPRERGAGPPTDALFPAEKAGIGQQERPPEPQPEPEVRGHCDRRDRTGVTHRAETTRSVSQPRFRRAPSSSASSGMVSDVVHTCMLGSKAYSTTATSVCHRLGFLTLEASV